MEQPLATKPPPTSPPKPTQSSSPRPPSPEEVLAHYESRGLDPKSASLKAISDLQSLLLLRSPSSSSAAGSRRSSSSSSNPAGIARKLDGLSARLAVLDVKLDSKPGLAQSVGVGVASGAIVSAARGAWPHIVSVWESVKSATRSSD